MRLVWSMMLVAGCQEYALSTVVPEEEPSPPAQSQDSAPTYWDDVIYNELVPEQDVQVTPPEHESPDLEVADTYDLDDCEPGYQAVYYNLSGDHPDVQAPAPGLEPGVFPTDRDWFSEGYFWEGRVDASLEFGDDWWPVSSDQPGDPAHFAVHWRGWFTLDEAQVLTFFLSSDDDAWVLIDGIVVADQGGIHPAEERCYSVTVEAGSHQVDIFTADRHPAASSMWFEWEDTVEVLSCGDL